MISLRLKAIAFFIEKNDRVVDIGCDHAYLGIYLLKNNLCKNVIASDININALNAAEANINKYGLSKKIKTILSDGLNEIDVTNINTIVVAGMGTRTIKKIISNKDKMQNIEKVIVASHNDLYDMRKYMNKSKYKLEDEKIIYDKNHYYVILKYVKGKQKLSKRQLMYGIYKKENINYYKNLYKENKSVLKKIPLRKIKERFKLYFQNKKLKNYLK